MKKLCIAIGLAVTLAGCAHRAATVNPASAPRHHAVHKVAPAPVAPPAVAPAPAPVVQVAPPPVTPAPIVGPAPKPAEKKNAWRWIWRDRSTSGGK